MIKPRGSETRQACHDRWRSIRACLLVLAWNGVSDDSLGFGLRCRITTGAATAAAMPSEAATPEKPLQKWCPIILGPLCSFGGAMRRAFQHRKPLPPPLLPTVATKATPMATNTGASTGMNTAKVDTLIDAVVVAQDDVDNPPAAAMPPSHSQICKTQEVMVTGMDNMTVVSNEGDDDIPPVTQVSRSVLWGGGANADTVEVWTLKERATGTAVSICTLGATIVELWTPDRDGEMDDIVLGFPMETNDTATGRDENTSATSGAAAVASGLVGAYMSDANPYFGGVVGRVANRVAGASFTLDGVVYDKLAANNGANTLHGGIIGVSLFSSTHSASIFHSSPPFSFCPSQ